MPKIVGLPVQAGSSQPLNAPRASLPPTCNSSPSHNRGIQEFDTVSDFILPGTCFPAIKVVVSFVPECRVQSYSVFSHNRLTSSSDNDGHKATREHGTQAEGCHHLNNGVQTPICTSTCSRPYTPYRHPGPSPFVSMDLIQKADILFSPRPQGRTQPASFGQAVLRDDMSSVYDRGILSVGPRRNPVIDQGARGPLTDQNLGLWLMELISTPVECTPDSGQRDDGRSLSSPPPSCQNGTSPHSNMSRYLSKCLFLRCRTAKTRVEGQRL